uniref:Cystatin-12-like n=2 Tax=Marmota marmota marmota TaxID=9994 RepID=A0A8C5YVU4_MARMA
VPLVLTLAAMLWKVLLFVGLVVLGAHLCSNRFVDIDKTKEYFALSLEYAIFWFNEALEDKFAYKFLRVRRSQRELFNWTYLIDVEMGRTICKKHDEDIDNCPLQKGAGEKKVRCTFIVFSLAWMTKFNILNSTCLQT